MNQQIEQSVLKLISSMLLHILRDNFLLVCVCVCVENTHTHTKAAVLICIIPSDE